MITATYTKSGGDFILTVEGHAGFAPEGQDIICAAASALTLALAQTVRFFDADRFFTYSPTVDISRGKSCIICTPEKKYYYSVKAAFDTVFNGFSLLSRNAPEHAKTVRHTES